jgi:membrane protease YdiL (CAAX protease family)
MNDNLFIQAARSGKTDFWRYLLTILLVTFLFLSGGMCLAIVVLVSGSMNLDSLPPAVFLALNLFPFFFVLAGLGIALPLFHQRSPLTLVNPERRFALKPFVISAITWLLVTSVGDIILAVLQPGNYVFEFHFARFFPWMAAAVLLLPFQCAAEELFFRGYLTQGFGLAGGFWLAWLVPSLLFGLLHGANPEVLQYGPWLTLPIYIGTGLLMGWVTLRSEGLEMALGLHIANNYYSALLVTFPSSALPAPALFQIQQYHSLSVLIAFLVSVPIYLALMSWFGRDFFRLGLLGYDKRRGSQAVS